MIETNKIYCGDTLKILKTFPDECVDMCMTSPPYYGLRTYGVDGQIGLENSFSCRKQGKMRLKTHLSKEEINYIFKELGF